MMTAIAGSGGSGGGGGAPTPSAHQHHRPATEPLPLPHHRAESPSGTTTPTGLSAAIRAVSVSGGNPPLARPAAAAEADRTTEAPVTSAVAGSSRFALSQPHIARTIFVFLAAASADRYALATLLRLEPVQAAYFTGDGNRRVFHAARRGDVAVLDWLRQHGRVRFAESQLPAIGNALADASADGHAGVLRWWRDVLTVTVVVQTRAIAVPRRQRLVPQKPAGHPPVIPADRGGNAMVEVKWTDKAVDLASRNGHTNVLRWWKESGWEMKYSREAMDDASKWGRVESLQWWKDSGLPLLYSANAMDFASVNGHLDVLQWWKDSELELKYTTFALDGVGNTNNSGNPVEVMEWWKNSGLSLKYTAFSMELASKRGSTAVLQWWKDSGLEIKYSDRALIGERCSDDVVRWWKESGLGLAAVAEFILAAREKMNS